MSLFIGSLLVTIVFSFIQTTNWILFGEIKPDLALVTLIILAKLNRSWLRRGILILTTALVLQFSPHLDLFTISFIGTTIIGIALLDRLPWQHSINLALATILATIIINLGRISFPLFIYGMVFNLFIAFILFFLTKPFHVPEATLQRNRF